MGAKEKNIKKVLYFWLIFNTIEYIGAWRSLVARTAGGREVAGSNPVAPIFLCFHSAIFSLFQICFLHFEYFCHHHYNISS